MNATVKCKKGEEILKYGSSVCKRGYFKTAKSIRTITEN
jgi:hypothetical protein